MRILILASFFLFVLQGAFCDEDAVYYIRDVEYDITGKTKPFALLIAAEITSGEEIRGDAGLVAYVEQKKQAILNQRQIESAEVAYVIGEKDAAGKYPVDLVLKTADTNNFIILPYPKFSSSSGTKLELRLRDFNFLGVLRELKINAGYMRDADANDYATAALGFELPFQGLGLLWRFGFDNDFSYRIDNASEPVYFNNVSSLAVDLPVYRTVLTLGFAQTLTVKKEELFDYDSAKSPFEYLTAEDKDVFDFHNNLRSCFVSTPFASWAVPLGVPIFSFGELTYRPVGGIDFVYWPFENLPFYPAGPVGFFSHSLGFSRIDWHGNFQRGLSLNVEQNNELAISGGGENKHDVSVTGIGHVRPADFFGFSFRARYQRVLFGGAHYLAIGGALRGIADKSLAEPEKNLTAVELAFVNLDMPFSIFKFQPSRWGSGKRLTAFDLEFHLSPFVDAALFENDDGKDEWLLSGGLELKIFPLAFRSFFLRVSYGADFRTSGGYELYIGLGNHY